MVGKLKIGRCVPGSSYVDKNMPYQKVKRASAQKLYCDFSQKPLKLAVEIVWSSYQGIGENFTHLIQHQLVLTYLVNYPIKSGTFLKIEIAKLKKPKVK